MQIISQEKILPWGLMVLRESNLNGYCPKGILVTFWKRAGFEGGERETDLLVHTHCIISLLSSISFILSSVFSLFFFFSFSCFLLLCFSFYSVKCSVFDPPLRARQRSLYSACRGQFFTTFPLNRLCLVWAHLPTTKGVCHLLLPDRGRFHFSVYRSTSFLPRYKCFFSLSLKACTQRFPLKLASFG